MSGRQTHPGVVGGMEKFLDFWIFELLVFIWVGNFTDLEECTPLY